MYAESRYMPRQSRSVSLGAALAINGALIAGLWFAAPNLLPEDPPTTLEGRNIPLPPTPPPPKPRDIPKTDARLAQAPLPHAPDPVVDTPSRNPVETTDIIYPPLPPLPPIDRAGSVVEVDQPPAALALVAATPDPRYRDGFQPAYPASELRAQRDGAVSVRVLIGTDGRVKAVEQVSATSAAFFEATRRQALARWRFKPANRGGVPEESWKILNVRFELKNL
ncbi:energy transducer TonB [Sphingomonas sp. M1-B02]|uniref:energy transducer TonB n=1 Tax=Sphingomonas sp. M1-B02 TaxID=3114300 RepID=UPI0022404A8D|nr:energy transducer TonB [Sphingomonas sp. S6-11]UZK65278.1 energy transducer TonB [Sphingomonas sp. S6-11]